MLHTYISAAVLAVAVASNGTIAPEVVAADGPIVQANGGDAIAPGQTRRGVFDQSSVYPGTTRQYAVYVPESFDAERDGPAHLMVFMDGMNYLKEEGAFQVPQVFEALMARG